MLPPGDDFKAAFESGPSSETGDLQPCVLDDQVDNTPEAPQLPGTPAPSEGVVDGDIAAGNDLNT